MFANTLTFHDRQQLTDFWVPGQKEPASGGQ